jgi:hypothetical protein
MAMSGRKIRVAASAVSLLVGALGLAASVASLGSAGAAGMPLPPSTAHGANFLFESVLDTNFCIDVAPGTTEGRAVTLSACLTADTERWALTENTDGTNAFIDSEGMCLDSTGHKLGDGNPLEVFDCGFRGHERFSYTVDGLIQAKVGCLSVQAAATGTAVSLAPCDNTSKHEMFKLAH